jgi:hypothetical protein
MAHLITARRELLGFVAIMIVSAGACLLSRVFVAPGTTVSEDSWRRTEQGWERVTNWNDSQVVTTVTPPVFHSPPPLSANASPRWDTHPAALAFVQLAAVCSAFLAFPAGHRWSPGLGNRLSHGLSLRRLPQFVANSFRASAFG